MTEKQECCLMCLKCPDYPNGTVHHYCHNKSCDCHTHPRTPQKEATWEEPRPEAWEEDAVEVFMLLQEDLLEHPNDYEAVNCQNNINWFRSILTQAREQSKREERGRIEAGIAAIPNERQLEWDNRDFIDLADALAVLHEELPDKPEEAS